MNRIKIHSSMSISRRVPLYKIVYKYIYFMSFWYILNAMPHSHSKPESSHRARWHICLCSSSWYISVSVVVVVFLSLSLFILLYIFFTRRFNKIKDLSYIWNIVVIVARYINMYDEQQQQQQQQCIFVALTPLIYII